MVERSLLTFSLMRVTLSERCAFCLSRRSICDCRSLTTRSTLRTLRWDLLRSSSWVSSWFSSCERLANVSRLAREGDGTSYLVDPLV